MGQFTFEEQVNFFRKKIDMPSENYTDIYGEMHNYAFAVAGANTVELVTYFKEAATAFIERGETIEEFRKRFDEIVAKTGWQYNGGRNWRTRIIYDTNIYSSYNQGRYAQQMELIDVLPYWEYQHNDAHHPRKEHLDWDGLILPANDPWWATHYPIRAYGCHCTVQALDDYDLKKEGKTVAPKAPEIEWEDKIIGKRSGNPQVVRVPKGVDPSFEHPKSLTPISQVDQLLMHKLELKSRQPHTGVTKEFVANTVRHLMNNPAIMGAMNASMKHWVNAVSEYVETDNTELLKTIPNFKYIGTLPAEVLPKLPEEPISAMVVMDRGNMVHALREIKQNAGISLPTDFWEKLPEKIQMPDAILLEKGQATPTLLFVYKTDKGKVSVKIDYDVKATDGQSKKWVTQMNKIVTGSIVDERHLESLGAFDVLWGNL